MEVFAAQLEDCDVQIGRVIKTLERIGELDNTLIFVTSDNGASGEGGLAGTFNETYVLNGMQTPFDANMRHLDHWRQTDTYPRYDAGWAMAGNTPFPSFNRVRTEEARRTRWWFTGPRELRRNPYSVSPHLRHRSHHNGSCRN